MLAATRSRIRQLSSFWRRGSVGYSTIAVEGMFGGQPRTYDVTFAFVAHAFHQSVTIVGK